MDIERIRKSKKVWVRADKFKNIYQVCPYEQILNNKITESYKIDHSGTPILINRDTAKFANKLQIVNRFGKIEENVLTFYLKTINRTSKIRNKLETTPRPN